MFARPLCWALKIEHRIVRIFSERDDAISTSSPATARFFALFQFNPMPIKLKCQCGSAYQVKDEHAGKVCQCRQCGQKMRVPYLPSPAASQISAAVAGPVTPTAAAPPPVAAAPPAPAEEPCPSCQQPLAAEKAVCPNCRYSKHLKRCLKKKVDRPVQAPASSRSRPETRSRESAFSSHSFDWGAIGFGLLMLVGGVVVFGGLFLAGLIYPYALIISVIGLVNVIKGLIGY